MVNFELTHSLWSTCVLNISFKFKINGVAAVFTAENELNTPKIFSCFQPNIVMYFTLKNQEKQTQVSNKMFTAFEIKPAK